MAFKPILEGQSCIVADQTGSGKTLAYLAPLVQMLRAEEELSQTKQSKKPPRVLVLVPTSELAVQVGAVDWSEQFITPRKASVCHRADVKVSSMDDVFTFWEKASALLLDFNVLRWMI